MKLKQILVILYTLPLMVFLCTTIFAVIADMIGSCAYNDGTITHCTAWGRDYSWLYDTATPVGFMSNWAFLVAWILLGGCTMYALDWLKKRNA
ncbi:hypothetical protein [Neptunicoccus cionae]|uniref:hypothetical protein n=1 Tax=Neptunicoccus cionae TaxID=2035344 RepID=UPI000C78E0EF|nr:hypothetical protein [Amylibacter cionae]PLS22010.1 hypothetical protein C0U40_06105 [Amylibacter cionae]